MGLFQSRVPRPYNPMRNSRQRRQATPRRSDRGRGATLAIAAGIVLAVLVILAVIGYFFVQAVTGSRTSEAAVHTPAAVTSEEILQVVRLDAWGG